LYKQKDILNNEITEIRRWKTEVYSNSYTIKSEIYWLEYMLSQTKDLLEIEKQNFYKLTDKQRNKIFELNNEINNKIWELTEYNSKKLIDIDWENKKYKKVLTEKRKEIQVLTDNISQITKEQKEFIEYRACELEKIQQMKNKIEKDTIALNIKQKTLNIKEKRLLKFKKELNVKN